MATFATKKTGVRPPITSWEYYIEDKEDWERYKNILKLLPEMNQMIIAN